MSNWDDWVYFDIYEFRTRPKKVFLKFCLNCGENPNILGPRYSVSGAIGKAILLDKNTENDCNVCLYHVFTGYQYKKITERDYFT